MLLWIIQIICQCVTWALNILVHIQLKLVNISMTLSGPELFVKVPYVHGIPYSACLSLLGMSPHKMSKSGKIPDMSPFMLNT